MDTPQKLASLTSRIVASEDGGRVFFNPTTGEVLYSGGDGDSTDEGHTPPEVIESILLEAPGVKSVRCAAEEVPTDDFFFDEEEDESQDWVEVEGNFLYPVLGGDLKQYASGVADNNVLAVYVFAPDDNLKQRVQEDAKSFEEDSYFMREARERLELLEAARIAIPQGAAIVGGYLAQDGMNWEVDYESDSHFWISNLDAAAERHLGEAHTEKRVKVCLYDLECVGAYRISSREFLPFGEEAVQTLTNWVGRNLSPEDLA